MTTADQVNNTTFLETKDILELLNLHFYSQQKPNP